MESIWSSTTQFKEYPTLQGDTKADVAVIGGGLAGILTAFLLKKHNIHAVVLEAAKIGSGQTQHTTAKITSQHDIMYSKLMKNFDAEKQDSMLPPTSRPLKAIGKLFAKIKLIARSKKALLICIPKRSRI